MWTPARFLMCLVALGASSPARTYAQVPPPAQDTTKVKELAPIIVVVASRSAIACPAHSSSRPTA